MKLTEEVKIIFKNSEGLTKELSITIDKLIDSTSDDLYSMLEETTPCTCCGCNNESQNFCDCGGNYEDYLITDIEVM